MQPPELDVVGIGNAIVDIIGHAEDAFLLKQGMQKGGMTLIDEEKAEALYAAMGPAVQLSGGSAEMFRQLVIARDRLLASIGTSAPAPTKSTKANAPKTQVHALLRRGAGPTG